MTGNRFSKALTRLLAAVLMVLSGLGIAAPALAEVQVHFHSFNGSVLWGRTPHTFVVFEGSLEDGTPVAENSGFSARSGAETLTSGPDQTMLLTANPGPITHTTRHYSINI